MNFLLGLCVCCALLLSLATSEAFSPNKPGEYSWPDEENEKLTEEISSLKEEMRKLKKQCKDDVSSLKEENENLNEQIAEYKADSGDNADTDNIWDAAERGSLPAVIFYFKQDPNNINKRNETFHSYTPLMYASRKGHANIVRFLISKGAEIDAINTDGNTALLIASYWGHVPVVEHLINKGANLDIQNKDERAAIHAAVAGDKLQVVRLLVQKGADLTLKDEAGRTPLDLAKKKGFTAIVECLS